VDDTSTPLLPSHPLPHLHPSSTHQAPIVRHPGEVPIVRHPGVAPIVPPPITSQCVGVSARWRTGGVHSLVPCLNTYKQHRGRHRHSHTVQLCSPPSPIQHPLYVIQGEAPIVRHPGGSPHCTPPTLNVYACVRKRLQAYARWSSHCALL
jgi:hypothetical protein